MCGYLIIWLGYGSKETGTWEPMKQTQVVSLVKVQFYWLCDASRSEMLSNKKMSQELKYPNMAVFYVTFE